MCGLHNDNYITVSYYSEVVPFYVSKQWPYSGDMR